jgi:hypothetical protein
MSYILDTDLLLIIENITEHLDEVSSLENQIRRLTDIEHPNVSPQEYFFYFERNYYKDLYSAIKEPRTYNTMKYVLHNALIGIRFEYNDLIDFYSKNHITDQMIKIEQDTKRAIYIYEQKLKLLNKITETK